MDKWALAVDLFFARDDAATYTEPLALQLFPVTESREQGKMRDSADIKIVNGDKDPSFFYAMYAAAKLGIAWNVPRNGVGIDWSAIAKIIPGLGAT